MGYRSLWLICLRLAGLNDRLLLWGAAQVLRRPGAREGRQTSGMVPICPSESIMTEGIWGQVRTHSAVEREAPVGVGAALA